MRRSLTLTLLLALPICLGADCGGGSSHGSAGTHGTTTTQGGPVDYGDQPGVAPVPEPSGALLFAASLAVAAVLSRRIR